MIKKAIKSSQFALFLLFVVTVAIFGVINPDILTRASLFSLARTCAVPAIFALAIMIIMVIGELDMSFCMIGAFASYSTMYFLTEREMSSVSIFLVFLMSIAIGVVLQLFNWVLVDRLRLQSFIATLGTQSFLKGTILAFVSSSYIYKLPASVNKLGTWYLATASYSSGVASQLPGAIIFTLLMYVALYLTLEYTNFGRQLYAVGGDADAARRAGINVSRVRFFAFLIVGVICGVGGVVHNSLGRCSLPMPTDLVGTELTGIAAVVLGRGSQMHAKGIAIGTLLGIVLLQFISNNLIMIGIPTYYQSFVTGAIIFVGLVMQMRQRGGLLKVLRKEVHAE
ncbi:Ribose import permease protein RbsC [bioreactor metagenome]|uniref:Ribose import permease protein RbsC n=1 Tax=bioreactor metagenome TaxID=1076179 RepID=A0A644XWY8_9ZZZZ|nr:ABC transporter permease [Oscillibacter sp.]